MKSYVQQLKLSFDPFEASTASREFFEGGNRSQILDQIVERAMYSESLIAVSGCLGSGKTSLLTAISQSFGEEAVVVNVVTTLFMNPDQFMDQLVEALQLPGEFESIEESTYAVTRLAGQLHMDARSLLIQIDDAHELSSDVLKHLLALTSDAAADSVHVILFGESQLGNVLENTLDKTQLANLAEFELEGFGSEATIDYIRFKLESAGYNKPLPLVGDVLGVIHNSSNGLPGAINALVRDALNEEFAEDIELVGVEAEEFEAAGIEFGALESKFSANEAIEENDYTGDEREEFSAAREVEVPETVDDDATSISKRYLAAAAVLLVVLIAAIVLVLPNQSAETEVARISVPVSGPLNVSRASAAPTSQTTPEEVSLSAIAQRPRASAALDSDVAEPDSEQKLVELSGTASRVTASLDAVSAASVVVVDEVAEEVAEAIVQDSASLEPAIIAATPVSAPDPASTAPSVVPSSASSAASGTVVRAPSPVTRNSAIESPSNPVAEPASNSTSASLSSFERTLLSYPSSSYTVQIVGASSESNIQSFVKTAQLDVTVGYFETRLNDKPWYVVIAGNFPDRESATALISSLPDSAKTSGPWVRGLADIQADIQKLQ